MKKNCLIWLFCFVWAGVQQLVAVSSHTQADTITLLSFNDFHGAFVHDKNMPGAAVFVEALLEAERNNPHAVLLSGGDNFSGSYFARLTRGCPVDELFRVADVKMSAVGNHEFDWGQSFLTDTAAHYISYLAANIQVDKTKKPLFEPYKLLHIPVQGGDTFAIGVVGLTTTETGRKTKPEYVAGLTFSTPNSSMKAYCQQVRDAGADMVVALMHVGTEMKNGQPVIKEHDADSIPYIEGVDAVVSAHSHNVVLGTIYGKPVVQAGTNGTHIGLLQFLVEKNDNGEWSTRFLRGDTLRVPLDGKANADMANAVATYERQYGFNEQYAWATKDLVHDRTVNPKEYTEVGALVTAAYAHKYDTWFDQPHPVIGVNHFNGIRSGLSAGVVTKLRAGNVLPFGGNLRAYDFSGKTLKVLLNAGRSNPNGFLQTSNLKLFLDNQGQIVRVSTLDGEEIKDDDLCVVVCDEFIAKGGDGYDTKLFVSPIEHFAYETTAVFLDYLKTLGTIPNDQARQPLVMDGSAEHPYEIATKADLMWVRSETEVERSRGMHYRQTADIDLSSEANWIPIGTWQQPFCGHYDGGGHAVRNIKCNRDDLAGLFGCVRGGSIMRLQSGSLGDYSDIVGKTAAGICAYMDHGSIINCCNYAYVHDANYSKTTLGGVCGYSNGGTVAGCVNIQTVQSSVSQDAVVGGVLGTNAFGASMERCVNYGNVVNKSMQTGGVCAVSNEGMMKACFNMGTVSGGKRETGAVCGWNNGTVTGCHYWLRDGIKGIGGGKKGDAQGETQKKMEELIAELFR